MKVIQTSHAPEAIGSYSQAIQAGNTLYFSGQIPLDPLTMKIIEGDLTLQANQVFKNLKALAEAAGGSMDDIVKLTVYLIDISHVTIVNELMKQYFTKNFPARTTIGVSALPKNVAIEIDAIMVTGE